MFCEDRLLTCCLLLLVGSATCCSYQPYDMYFTYCSVNGDCCMSGVTGCILEINSSRL